jgi:hypothetical protein
MTGVKMCVTAALVAIAMLPLMGCPEGEPPVEILLVNAFEEAEVRTLRLYDAHTPVSDNLLASPVQAKHCRRILVPFEDTLAADAICVWFGTPGEDLTVAYLPDDVEGGFAPGKIIPFVVCGNGAFDTPLDNMNAGLLRWNISPSATDSS